MEQEFWSVRAKKYNQLEWAKRESYLEAFVGAGDFQVTDWVLDVGTGTGIVAHAVSPLVAQVIGVDISSEMLDHARASRVSNESFKEGNIYELPFSSNSFDKVTARMVFHHLLKDIHQGMKECYRVLKPGGALVLSEGVPPHRSLADWYTKMFALKEERLTFFEEDLTSLMQNAGFGSIRVITHISPQVSIGNWLRGSSLPFDIQNNIMQMHLNLDTNSKQYYNMKITADDVLCDFKYLILVGHK